MEILVIGTGVIVGWTLWQRRITFMSPSDDVALMDRTMSASLLLQVMALVLMSHFGSASVGRLFFAMTGQWNVNAYIGHCLYLSAGCEIACYVMSRLDISNDELREMFKRWVALPMTVAFPVMLALFMQDRNADRRWPDFFDCPTGPWLDAYWMVINLFLIHLAVLALRVLLILRKDRRNGCVIHIYIAACAAAILSAVVRIYAAFFDDRLSHHSWYVCCACAIAFSYASREAWRERLRRLSSSS